MTGVELARPPDAALRIFDHLQPLGDPAHGAGDGEHDREHVGGQSQRLQDDAGIEIDIREELALDEIVVFQRDALQFHRQLQQRLVFDAEFVQDFVASLAHHGRARIVILVDAMSEAHQSEGVVLVLRSLDEFEDPILGGLLFLYNSIHSGGNFNVGTGVLLSMVAMAAWAGYTVTLYYLGGADRVTVLGVQHTISSLLIAPFLGIYMLSSPLVFVLDVWSVLGILFSGVVSSAIGYILYFKAIETIGAPRAASFLFLIPFVSLLGDIMLHELPPPIALTGGVAASLGVALSKKDSQ